MRQASRHFDASDRNFVQRHLSLGWSQGAITGVLGRPTSAVSREVRRNGASGGSYDAVAASPAARGRRRRGPVSLSEGAPLREHVFAQIRQGWSSQQIWGRLKQMPPTDEASGPALGSVSHETIYRTVYVMPKGEIRKELIGLLRQGRKLRRPRSQGKDRRGGLKGMVSIHERPASVLTREVFGDWDGDFIKGAGNSSAVGTLVERKSRFTLLAKMKDCGADAA